MQFKDLFPFFISILILHLFIQVYFAFHCYQNSILNKKNKILYMIGIVILNLFGVSYYLFKTREQNQKISDMDFDDKINGINLDVNTRQGIFFVLIIIFEIFAIRVISENYENPFYYLIIILLACSLLLMFVNNLFLKESSNFLYHLIPILQLFLIIPIEFFDYSYNAHLSMLVVVASIINKFPIKNAKIYSIAAFCAFIGGSTAKALRHYHTLGLEGTSSYLYLSSIVFLLVIFAFYSYKKYLLMNKRLDHALFIVNDQAKQIEEIGAVAERSRITAEIHDNVGHRLMGAILTIEDVEKNCSHNQEAKEKLSHAKEQIKQGLDEIRHSVRVISDIGKKSFFKSLNLLLSEIKDNTGFTINCNCHIKNDLLSIQQLLLLQSIKECVTNSLKYGKCFEADLLIQEFKENIYFTFSDNGEGVNDTILGFGLSSMKDRVHSLGGTFNTESNKGEGFTVSISIPLGSNHGGDL